MWSNIFNQEPKSIDFSDFMNITNIHNYMNISVVFWSWKLLRENDRRPWIFLYFDAASKWPCILRKQSLPTCQRTDGYIYLKTKTVIFHITINSLVFIQLLLKFKTTTSIPNDLSLERSSWTDVLSLQKRLEKSKGKERRYLSSCRLQSPSELFEKSEARKSGSSKFFNFSRKYSMEIWAHNSI